MNVKKLIEKIKKENDVKVRIKDNNVIVNLCGQELYLDLNATYEKDKSIPRNIIFKGNGNLTIYADTLGSNIKFLNQGFVLLRTNKLGSNTVFKNGKFIELSVKKVPKNLIFKNSGGVSLYDVKKIRKDTLFKNKGYLVLHDLESLPKDYIFHCINPKRKKPEIYFRDSNFKFDEYEAGRFDRNLYVIMTPMGLQIPLGCFCGTERQAIEAVTRKYNSEFSMGLVGMEMKSKYIGKIQSAFKKARKRWKIEK